MNTEDVTLVEAVSGLTRDLTTLHRQVDAACVELRYLRGVNAELLAALKAVVDCDDGGDHGGWVAVDVDVVRRAIAAIQKAEAAHV